MTVAIILLALIVLLAVGMPVAFSLGLVSLVALFILKGTNAMLIIAQTAFSASTAWTFLPLPFFILMSEIIMFSGISGDLFKLADKWLGRLPGSLARLSFLPCHFSYWP